MVRHGRDEVRPELEQAITAWQRATDELVAVVRGVGPDRWLQPSANPGWTNKDLLAHLATGYAVRLAVLESVVTTGRPGAVPDADAANAHNIEARRGTPVADLVAEMLATRGTVLRLIQQLQDAHLDVVVELGDAPARLGAHLPDLSRHDLDHAAEFLRR